MVLKFLFSCTVLFSSINLEAKIIEKVVAIVEGEMILKSDISKFKARLKNGELVNLALLGLFDQKKVAATKESILDYLIAKKIILLQAKKEKIVVNEKLINRELGNLANANSISTKELEQEIKNRGIDLEVYKEFIGETAVTRNVIEREVVSRVRPSEEDFLSYLKKNGVTKINTEYEYELAQIYFSKGIKDARKKIEKITTNNFLSAGQRVSSQEGEYTDLGKLKMGQMSKLISKPLKGLSRGDLTSIISDESGYRVLYVKDRTSSTQIPNTKKVAKLRETFFKANVESQFKNWLNNIKNSFFVRKN